MSDDAGVCYCGSRGEQDGCLMPVYNCYGEDEKDEQ